MFQGGVRNLELIEIEVRCVSRWKFPPQFYYIQGEQHVPSGDWHSGGACHGTYARHSCRRLFRHTPIVERRHDATNGRRGHIDRC